MQLIPEKNVALGDLSLASSHAVLLFTHTSAGRTVSISVTAACCSSTDTLMFLFRHCSAWWLVPVVTVACCSSTDTLTFLYRHTAAPWPVLIIAAAWWILYDMLIFLVTHTAARWFVPITIVAFHNLTDTLMFCPANKITILVQKWCRAIPWIYSFQISLKALYFPLKHASLQSHPVQILCWYTCCYWQPLLKSVWLIKIGHNGLQQYAERRHIEYHHLKETQPVPSPKGDTASTIT